MHFLIDGARWVLVGAQYKSFKHKGQQPDGSGVIVVKVIVGWSLITSVQHSSTAWYVRRTSRSNLKLIVVINVDLNSCWGGWCGWRGTASLSSSDYFVHV